MLWHEKYSSWIHIDILKGLKLGGCSKKWQVKAGGLFIRAEIPRWVVLLFDNEAQCEQLEHLLASSQAACALKVILDFMAEAKVSLATH